MNSFENKAKAWQDLEPLKGVTLSNREILNDTVMSMCTLLDTLRPYVVHKAPQISVGLLTEAVATLQTNVRWLKVIVERHKPQQRKPVTEEEILPY